MNRAFASNISFYQCKIYETLLYFYGNSEDLILVTDLYDMPIGL